MKESRLYELRVSLGATNLEEGTVIQCSGPIAMICNAVINSVRPRTILAIESTSRE